MHSGVLSDASLKLVSIEQDHSSTTYLLHAEKEKTQTLTENNSALTKRLNFYSKGTYKRKLQVQQEKNTRLQEELKKSVLRTNCLEKQLDHYKAQLKKSQLALTDLGRDFRKTTAKLQRKEQDEIDQQGEPHPEGAQAEDVPVLRLKDDRGYFTNEAIVCVIRLVGENEVPPGRCGSVIQTVAQNIMNAMVPDSDLPSMRSAERFADRGHVIGKLHIAEALLQSEHWDLHTDGTSRCGKKYVSQQMNVPGKTLSSGFVPVSTENTTTLVDITINLLHELSDLYSEEQAQETFTSLLKGMSAVMSDRAAVMKSFGRALDEERRGMLQTDDELHFLYCNAHFLLGLSTACEKVLKKLEKDSGQRLGRDKLPKFQSFKASTESSVSRQVHSFLLCLHKLPQLVLVFTV